MASRELTEGEINFALKISQQSLELDFVGLDIVRFKEGRLYLLEVNRSPGFSAFEELTGDNIAEMLYL